MITQNTVNLTEESTGIEVLVTYTKEDGCLELKTCEIVIKGGPAVDITKQLSWKQQQNILDQVELIEAFPW